MTRQPANAWVRETTNASRVRQSPTRSTSTDPALASRQCDIQLTHFDTRLQVRAKTDDDTHIDVRPTPPEAAKWCRQEEGAGELDRTEPDRRSFRAYRRRQRCLRRGDQYARIRKKLDGGLTELDA
jgi:hypothetical protein